MTPNDKKSHTLADIAEVAGVSVKTVSRVINDEGGISRSTNESVLGALREMNYRPNIAARQMRENDKYSISVAYETSLRLEYLHGVLSSILTILKEKGHRVMLEPVSSNEDLVKFQKVIKRRMTHGVIVLPPLSENQNLIDKIVEQKIPRVLVASSLARTDCPNVGIDDYEAGRQMGRHLIQKGHSKISWISLPHSHKQANLRELGLADELQSSCAVGELLRMSGDGTYDLGYKSCMALMKLDDPPTALFAGNDYIGLGALAAARDLNIKVPDELAVCGFDGGDVARYAVPSLTTIRQPLTAIGQTASYQLLNQFKEKEKTHERIFLDYEFISGASTG